MTSVLELLKWMRSQLSLVWEFRPSTAVTQFVPTRAKLAASPDLNTTFQSYRSEVLARFVDVDTAHLIDKLKNARAQATAMRTAPALQPIPNLPGNVPARFDERLLLEGAETNVGFGLASGVTDPASITDKAAAVVELRRVDDILIRVWAANRAATMTSQSLASILALYRVEGNLGVPPSASTLARIVPSDAITEGTSIVTFPENRSGRRVWPHLIWLAKKTGIYGNFSFAYPPIAPETDFEVKEPAVLDWGLQICGLDVLQNVFLDRPPGRSMTDAFASWSNDNWRAAGLTSNMAAARIRWQEIVNQLEITDVTSSEAVISVTPKDPVEFVGRLLAEGQAHLLAGERMLGAGALDLPMKYFVYHAGVEPAKRFFTRTLLEIHATSPAGFNDLRGEIREDAGYVRALDSLKPIRNKPVRNRLDQMQIESELEPHSAATMAWLAGKSPTRLDLLGKFLTTAGGNVWNTWTEHRGNLSRYMVLLDYYQRLFA
jgi:hypothetical protein